MLPCSLVWGGMVSLLLLFAILCLGGLCQSFQVSQDTTVVAVNNASGPPPNPVTP
jgi:hypothetical protein